MTQRVRLAWILGTSVVFLACADDSEDAAGGTQGTANNSRDDGSVDDDGPDSTPSDSTGNSDDSPEPTAGFPTPELDDCIVDGSSGQHTFSCGGLTYDVSIPGTCLSSACGLIVDIHGRTVSGKIHDNNTNMRALGLERGYIVVQPNANPQVPDSAWSAGDDAAVIDFTERMIAAFHVDSARVHVTGFSQGGFMTWRLACNSELFASVAPASACGGELDNADCNFQDGSGPSRVVPILYTHGTADARITFACAAPRRDAVVGHYGLDGPQPVADGNGHEWTRYTGADGMVLEFIQFDYRASAEALDGHCIVGGQDPGTEPGQILPINCVDEPAFVWGEAVIDFFEAHPRP
ncbi:MAG: hypothetical protein JKY37_10485 [Nannocystaceae bacterium]|nr:hypothetical protein [Nannocystaceae bacterium]